MIKAFVPLLRDGSRFIVVASSFGTLVSLDPRLHPIFDVGRMSLADVEQVMNDYVHAVETGQGRRRKDRLTGSIPRRRSARWPPSRSWPASWPARQYRRDILVNAACPGLVDTDASRPWFNDMSGALSPDEAAADVLWLATLRIGVREPYGELVQHRNVLPFAPTA